MCLASVSKARPSSPRSPPAVLQEENFSNAVPNAPCSQPAVLQEENFSEAVSNAHKVWAAPGVPPELRGILGDEAAAGIGPATPPFWVLVTALRRFLQEEGRGLLPIEVRWWWGVGGGSVAAATAAAAVAAGAARCECCWWSRV